MCALTRRRTPQLIFSYKMLLFLVSSLYENIFLPIFSVIYKQKILFITFQYHQRSGRIVLQTYDKVFVIFFNNVIGQSCCSAVHIKEQFSQNFLFSGEFLIWQLRYNFKLHVIKIQHISYIYMILNFLSFLSILYIFYSVLTFLFFCC